MPLNWNNNYSIQEHWINDSEISELPDIICGHKSHAQLIYTKTQQNNLQFDKSDTAETTGKLFVLWSAIQSANNNFNFSYYYKDKTLRSIVMLQR